MEKTINSFPTINSEVLESVQGGKLSWPLPTWTQAEDAVKGFLDGLTGSKRHYD